MMNDDDCACDYDTNDNEKITWLKTHKRTDMLTGWLWEEETYKWNKQTKQRANLDEKQDGWLTGWNCTGCLGELILQWLLWLFSALSHATNATTVEKSHHHHPAQQALTRQRG